MTDASSPPLWAPSVISISSEKIKMNEQTIQTLTNTVLLLKNGLFQGQNAPAVAECISLVEHLLIEAVAKAEADKASAAAPEEAKAESNV